MTPPADARTVWSMTDGAISGFTVHEFRLHDDVDRATAQERLGGVDGADVTVPLMTRIDDVRSFALVRAHHPGGSAAEDREDREVRAAIDRIGDGVRSRDFRARVALATPDAGAHFRLAVTEFGRNDAAPSAPDTWVAADGVDRPDADSQLLWIGITADSQQGLFVLVGHDVEEPRRSDEANRGWPLPLSSDLGVRIYTGTRA